MIKMDPVRVLIADDNSNFRKSMMRLLSLFPDIKIVAEAKNGQDAIQKTKSKEIDVILMDITMPILNGIDATRIIKNTRPDIRIVLWSVFYDPLFMDEAKFCGADIVTIKSESILDVMNLIRGIKLSI
jgi:DNA-binding NarL/FixJ family response regulator